MSSYDPAIRKLYKQLLALYPQDFRRRFAEPMQQTFNDLYKEQPRRLDKLVWIFTETGMGIVSAHCEQIKQGRSMNRMIRDFRWSAVIGIAMIVPFALLELTLNQASKTVANFPFALFALLWLLPMLFTFTFMPLIRSGQTGGALTASPLRLVGRVSLLALLALLWVAILRDQLPCFLGVPNCD